VSVVNAPDERVPSGVRPSVLAKIHGKSPRTVWTVSHIDTVAAGDESSWTYPPFDPQVVDGRIYGRGSEDDGQAVISTVYAAKALLDLKEEPELSIGLALVADEEAGSKYGIQYLLERGLFGKSDIIYVPDSGDDVGSVIEVAEKTIIWLRVTVKGKSVHASTPALGVNAAVAGAEALLAIRSALLKAFPDEEPLFQPPASTFEPTKRLVNVENVNTIPGEDVQFFDVRLLPKYSSADVLSVARSAASEVAERTGAAITVTEERTDQAGPASPTGSDAHVALAKAIKRVLNVDAKAIGVGGQTCSNWFRLQGIDAYVWQTVDSTLHQVDEYCRIEALVNDAKVYAAAMAWLCYGTELD